MLFRSIRRIVRELAPEPEGGGEDAHLVDDLAYHSLGMLELAFTLEDEFDLPAIDEETARRIVTIRHVEDHVVGSLRERGLLVD